jgi:hypothetical protein
MVVVVAVALVAVVLAVVDTALVECEGGSYSGL